MAYNFVGGDRDQLMLMPPSVADWLPGGHLAYFVVETVEALDLSAFRARYRSDGWGAAAYDPAVMVALVLYAYAVGERSSRRIERACVEQVPYRVVAANLSPDHATIARFRAQHDAALAELFSQVLGLCVRAGAVDARVVAVDGTKIEANASSQANLSREALEAYAKKVLAEAAAIDAEEDALYGDARGDELPEEWAPGPDRKERIRRALEELRAEQDEAKAEAEAKVADYEQAKAAGKPKRGQPPSGKPSPTRRAANVTDPDSRTLKSDNRYLQGYNAQAAVTPEQIIVAAELTNAASDATQLLPMVEATKAELDAAGASPPETVVADAGYWSAHNAGAETGCELLIAAKPQARPAQVDPEVAARRIEVIGSVETGTCTVAEAQELLGVSESWLNHLRRVFRAEGPEGLRAGASPPTERQLLAQAMAARLQEEDAASKFALRAQTVEPVFGQIKWNRGITRFARRGLTACRAEWRLIAATHNLLKLRSAGWRPSPPPAFA